MTIGEARAKMLLASVISQPAGLKQSPSRPKQAGRGLYASSQLQLGSWVRERRASVRACGGSAPRTEGISAISWQAACMLRQTSPASSRKQNKVRQRRKRQGALTASACLCLHSPSVPNSVAVFARSHSRIGTGRSGALAR